MFTLMDAVTQDGVGAALNCIGKSRAVLLISGPFTANVSFEASIDGTNYFSFGGRPNSGGAIAAVVAAPGHVEFDVRGVAYLRPRVSRYESGSVTVVGYTDVCVEEQHVLAAEVVDAGAYTEVVVDVSGFSAFTYGVVPDAAHDWQGAHYFKTLGGTQLNTEVDDFPTGSKDASLTARKDVLAANVVIRITNNDTAQHTYDVYLYGIRV